MHNRHGYGFLLTCVTFLCGCQASFEAIPTGRWEGQGTYASYKENAAGTLERTDGTYKTTVVITRRSAAGQDLRLVRVLADHTDDAFFNGASVHVILTLSDSGDSAGGSVLCKAHVELNTRRSAVLEPVSDDELEGIIKSQPAVSVTLSRSGWRHMLRVVYESPGKPGRFPFAETFTFGGDRLVKKGYHGSEAEADEAIQWREDLRKVE